ncbi:hypothetical protein [Helicobacter sp. MIT 05-5294]|uniref:hypothetical protein n=1 Tax=Helicobacter sp. MIT 05-5294 TaxID=1548150 RepID=UPI00051FEC66|nr:hypothetical protein [Helicobacter sp. MIT 05-5294]TLD85740.1 hypothetical protein LS69_008050 [Helicobacter sp. MIT 05-5294]
MVSYLNRRTILKTLILPCLALFVCFGCAKTPQNIQNSTSKTIFFSTKDFRFYDLGFVKTYPNHTTLEIFNAGVLLLQLECFKNKICLNQNCYSKDSFMRRLFGNDDFNDLDFNAVLLGKEIFFGQNKQTKTDGFIQNITRGNSTLHYQTQSDSIVLRLQNAESQTKFALEISAIP